MKNVRVCRLRLVFFVLTGLMMTGCIKSGIQPFGTEHLGPPSLPVEKFVLIRHMDRWPVEEGAKYDSGAVPILRQMLQDKSKSEYWGNMLVTLGLIGGSEAGDAILDFLSRTEIPDHIHETIARMSAVKSLGSWVWVSRNLRDSKFDKVTASEVISGLIVFIKNSGHGSGSHGTTEVKIPVSNEPKRKRLMQRAAVWGLGRSGDSEAKVALKSLMKTDPDPSLRSLAKEALAVHADIEKAGYLCHYEPEETVECQQRRAAPSGIWERFKAWWNGLFSTIEFKRQDDPKQGLSSNDSLKGPIPQTRGIQQVPKPQDDPKKELSPDDKSKSPMPQTRGIH